MSNILSKITVIIWCLFIIINTQTIGQNVNVDSLKALLPTTNSDSAKFYIYYDLYYHYFQADKVEATKWADKVAELTKSVLDKRILASSFALIGDHKGLSNNYIESNSCYQKALELNIELDDTLEIANSHFNLGITYDFIGDYNTALEHYQQSLKIFEILNDETGEADVLGNVAVMYSNQMDYQNSIKFFLKSLELREGQEESATFALDLGNLGAVYHDYGVQRNDTTMLNVALEYYENALKIQNAHQDKSMIAWIKANMGLLYNELKQYSKALELIKSSLTVSRLIDDKDGEATALGNIGEVHYSRKDYKTALEFYEKAYELAVEINNNLLVMESYESLALTYEKLNDFQLAYKYHSLFKTSQDSLYNVEKNAKFNELMALYDSEKKEQEIRDLQLEKKFNEVSIRQQKSEINLYIVVVSFLFVLAALILVFYLQLRRNKKKLEIINLDLVTSQKELTRLNKTKDRFFAIIAHDLRGAITSFQGIGQVIKNHLEKNRIERINVVADRIDSSAKQLNGLLDNLLNWAITQLGNVPFNPRKIHLKKLVDDTLDIFDETAQSKNIHLETKIPEEIYVHADQNGLSVVLRNLLNNALKFTDNDGEINVVARTQNGSVEVSISDTGMGISEDKLKSLFQLDDKKSTAGVSGEKGTGLGLLLCKEFISLHEGKISVESEVGIGSTFKFSLPKQAESQEKA